jgi:hypothetical protein
MKVLSVKNPWADWIIFGHKGKIKTTENRTWEILYRGRIYIHVSKQIDMYAVDKLFQATGEDLEYWKNQTGMIIGSVELYAIDREIKTEWDEPDLFHWRFKNPSPLERAIPARGSLGLWNYEENNGERKDGNSGKEKRKKPWKTCTWYPHECDAVGCDPQGYPCCDYKREETW